MINLNANNQANNNKIWNEFIINFFLYKINKYRENYQNSFVYLKESYLNLVEIFKLLETPLYLVEILKFFMKNLLFMSNLGDLELEQKCQKQECLDECGRILITFFSKFQSCDEKSIVFFCIICLIRIYFKLKTYRNSKTPVEWVDMSGLELSSLPKGEVTTFYYYSGRLALYEIKIIDAHKIFTNALRPQKYT